MRNKGYAISEIARALGRNKATISRELKRGSLVKQAPGLKKGSGPKVYEGKSAEHKARVRRGFAKYQGMLINSDDALRDYVIAGLKRGLSPEAIAGRMRYEGQGFYASRRAIYEWLYSPYGQRYCKYLRTHRYAKRKKKAKKPDEKDQKGLKTSIHDRPPAINNKSEYGHLEGDTIVSGKKTGSKVALSTIYERKSMYIDARKIKTASSAENNKALKAMAGKIENIKSLTLDNGTENAGHQRLSKNLKISIYFCDPYSSWQKPGIENANKLIRRYIPKGADISLYPHQFIRKIIRELNDTPRKALGWKTPREVLVEQRLLKNQNKKPGK